MSRRGSSIAIAASSSLPCSRIWTATIQQNHYPFDPGQPLCGYLQAAQACLETRPNRFRYVLAPTHESWLNIVEALFGKMARTFLKNIRAKSWEDRILSGVAEINAALVGSPLEEIRL